MSRENKQVLVEERKQTQLDSRALATRLTMMAEELQKASQQLSGMVSELRDLNGESDDE